MENEELNTLAENEEEKSAGFVYTVGEEAKDIDGNDVDSNGFNFVQQDRSIHDVKFNTKPTTFMKDALKRFTKNHSSVVGGVILGILFVLALILPVSMTSFDIDERHNYETHLPMKLFPAGTGFWDGTRVSKNEAYPYEVDENGDDVLDEEGNKIFTNYDNYPDESVVVKTSNKKAVYDSKNGATDAGNGGYVRLTADAGTGIGGYMFGQSYNKYDLTNNDYTITFVMGSCEGSEDYDYKDASYSIIMQINGNPYFLSADKNLNYEKNGGLSTDYGEEETKKDGAHITPHKQITFSLSDALNNAYTLITSSNTFHKISLSASDLTGKSISFGIGFMKDEKKSTAIFVQSYRIEGKTKKGNALTKAEQTALNARSFGSASASDDFSANDATVKDANDMVRLESSVKGVSNDSYWTRQTKDRFDATDTFKVTADVTYDMYKVTYGLRNNMEVSQGKLEEWKEAGLVSYTSLADLVANPGSFSVTEEGENSNDVYVTKITSVKMDNSSGTAIYTITAQFMMYKYLGYSSIPVHIFGTEYQGKDMLKYVFAGLRTSLILGIIVSLINIVIGVIWGSISGYYGGMVDITMERITDILGGIPYIVLMTVLTIKMGATFFVFALSLCLTGWIGTASTTRSQFYRYRGREYVLAAKTLGAKAPRLIFRHILPNAVGTIVTRSILMIPSTIFSEATIAYLGLGLTNLASLGVILSKNQAYLSTYPSELVVPAVIISLLMICFNLFGNGLRDAFNPSLKGED